MEAFTVWWREEYKFWILVLKLESLLTEPVWGERKEEAEGQEDNCCPLRGSLEEGKEKRDEAEDWQEKSTNIRQLSRCAWEIPGSGQPPVITKLNSDVKRRSQSDREERRWLQSIKVLRRVNFKIIFST